MSIEQPENSSKFKTFAFEKKSTWATQCPKEYDMQTTEMSDKSDLC